MKRFALFFALLLVLAPALKAVEFQPAFNGDIQGGYASTVGGTGASLETLDITYVPALKFGQSSLLPTIYAGAGGQERSISEAATFVKTGRLGFKPALRRELSQGRSYTLDLVGQRNWNMQAEGETIGLGVYDYDEFGGGATVNLPPTDLGFDLTLGLGASHRNYPNYHSSNSAASLTNNLNYYIKDFYSVAGQVTLGFAFHDLQISYRPEVRDYTDSYVVIDGGTLDLSQRQRDILQSLDLSLAFAPLPSVGFNLGGNVTYNDSNQASFDFASVPNKFIPDYEDYTTESLNLSFPWQADALWSGLTLVPTYGVLLRQSKKPVQDNAGAYQADLQNDIENSLTLNISKSLPAGFSWVASGFYKSVSSNQILTRGSLNTYDYWQATTGLSYAFQGAAAAAPASALEPGMDDPEFSDTVADPLKEAQEKAKAKAAQ